MRIIKINENKENFIDILLIGDESEDMIKKYLDSSNLFALYDNNILTSICACLKIDNKTIEIKNIATYPQYQKRGYGSKLLEFIFNRYKNIAKVIILGTGENEKTLNFYKKRGFIETHKVKNFFIDNYPNPIYEDGRRLKDMIYLKKYL